MGLYKAFGYILHNLLVATPHEDGLSEDAVTFVHSFLKRRKQYVKTNDIKIVFQILLSDIPQGSILGLILFNILINDLFFVINDV